MMNGADLGPNVFVAMQTIARKEGWTALYRGVQRHLLRCCSLTDASTSLCVKTSTAYLALLTLALCFAGLLISSLKQGVHGLSVCDQWLLCQCIMHVLPVHCVCWHAAL